MDDDGDPNGKRPFPFHEEDEPLEILSWALSPASEAVRDALILLESAPALTLSPLSVYAEYRECSVGEHVGAGLDNASLFPPARPHDAFVLLESAPVATLPSSSAFAANRRCTPGGNVGDGANENFHGSSIPFWALTTPPPAQHDAFFSVPALPSSAFFQYIRCSPAEKTGSCGAGNIHRRFIQFWQSMAAESWRRVAAKESMSEGNGGRGPGFQHMMRERQRRERMSQSYAELHSLLPRGSKGDKISIVRSVTDYLIELRWERERLWRRSRELELMNRGKAEEEGKKIKMEVKSASPFGNVISALRVLKRKGVEASAIGTEFSGEKLTVELVVETEEGRTEAERVLKAALDEIEES
ncbi:transcription factor BHLH148-like [Zingiber officinale]|uniref:transcription factor BHLH148-like n=1 Tax=Zingiber officinale TaxID=94328 RepID=UPI001C4DB8C2|nr:transcription factor BHLH148-like [Zingiber officinale]